MASNPIQSYPDIAPDAQTKVYAKNADDSIGWVDYPEDAQDASDVAAAVSAHDGDPTAHGGIATIVAGHTTDISGNTSQIATNTGEIAANTADIANLEAVSAQVPPAGGDVGQVLAKASGTDYDYAWATIEGFLTFDIKEDYGAKGDGVTDDTAAILACVAAAEAAVTRTGGRPDPFGVVVTAPPGRYLTTATIDITEDFVSFVGAGPSQTIIESTAVGPIMRVGGSLGALVFGNQIKGIGFLGDSVNTTVCLYAEFIQFYANQCEDILCEGFTEAGLYLDSVWNGTTFSNFFIRDSNNVVSGTQYGVYAARITNSIEFDSFNIQTLSSASDDTIGFRIESPQNVTISNSTVKNCWTAFEVDEGPDGNPCVGVEIVGGYSEPQTAPSIHPAEFAWMRLIGASGNPVRNVHVSNTKCGWGSDEVGIVCNIVDVGYVENVTFDHCNLKSNTTNGTTYHVKATANSKSVIFEDTCILSPEVNQSIYFGHQLAVNGDPTGVEYRRRALWIPATSLILGTGATLVDLGTDADAIKAVSLPDGSDSFVGGTFAIPSESWSGQDAVFARFLYTTDTAAGDICRVRAQLGAAEPGVGDDVRSITMAGNDQSVAEPTVAYTLESRTAPSWTTTVPRSGLVKMAIRRNGDDADDTCLGNLYILGVELYRVKYVTAIDGAARSF